MKVCLLLLAVLGVSYGAAVPAPGSRTLRDDVDELLTYIDVPAIRELARDFYENSEDGQKIAAYVEGPEFHKVIDVIRGYEQIREFVRHLESKNINAIAFLNFFAELIGYKPTETSFAQAKSTTWREFIAAVLEYVQKDNIISAFFRFLEESPEFKELFEIVKGSQDTWKSIMAEPAVINFGAKCREFGVDLDLIYEKVKGFFGWD